MAVKQGLERPPDLGRDTPDAALWFGLLGGGAAWFAHHAIGYGLVEINCHSDRLAGTVLGMHTAVFLAVALTALTAGVAVAAAITAFVNRPGSLGSDQEEPGARTVRGRVWFMSYVGTLISSLFLVAILTGASALLFLLPC